MIVLLCVPIRPVTRGAAPVLGKRQMILRSQLFECLGIGFSLVGQQNRHGACLGDDGHEVRVTIPARHYMLMEVSGDSCACYFALINADIVTVRTGDGFHHLHGEGGGLLEFEQFGIVEFGDESDVTVRADHEMPDIVWVEVHIESYRAKSEVVSSVLHHIDVFSIETDENTAYINYLHITNGCINQAFTFEYKVRMNESKEELLQLGIVEMRERYKSTSKEIIVPFELDMEMNGVTFTIPKKGEKKHLLDLSLMNVKQYKVDRLKQAEKLNPEQRSVRLMKEIQAQLQLEKMPNHIECFDNSNIQGSDAVAACVVFKKAKPSKKDYRKYLIKTVVGPDDYASMQEVVRRRYSRILEEQGELPDLILTDGGKGQMEVVRQVIEDELHLQIPIVGLAKNNRHRTSEVLFGFPPQTLGIKQGTPLFHLLENIQDEVHRFAITFHREKRSKSQIASALDNIKGIGDKRKTALLKTFKSVARIRQASLEEIAEVIGESAAKSVKESLSESK